MAVQAAKAAAKEAASGGVMGALKRKIGPAPAWVWLGLVAVTEPHRLYPRLDAQFLRDSQPPVPHDHHATLIPDRGQLLNPAELPHRLPQPIHRILAGVAPHVPGEPARQTANNSGMGLPLACADWPGFVNP